MKIKTITNLFFLCLMVGCQSTPNHRSEVTLTLEKLIYDENESNPLGLFKMVNNTDEPIWFFGFSLQDPLYEVHRKTEQGWEQIDTSMSATGSTPQILGPGKATWIPLEIIPEKGILQLQIGVSSPRHPKEVILGSNEFELSKNGKNI